MFRFKAFLPMIYVGLIVIVLTILSCSKPSVSNSLFESQSRTPTPTYEHDYIIDCELFSQTNPPSVEFFGQRITSLVEKYENDYPDRFVKNWHSMIFQDEKTNLKWVVIFIDYQ